MIIVQVTSKLWTRVKCIHRVKYYGIQLSFNQDYEDNVSELNQSISVEMEHGGARCEYVFYTMRHNHFILHFLVAGPTSCQGSTLSKIWTNWWAAGCPP